MPRPVSSLTLCWVGLVLSSPAARDERHQRQMDVEHVFASEVPAEFADRFQERQALDIADRAADLDDQMSQPSARARMRRFDLVGDMRDDLHRRAQIIAAPFLLDHGVVDLAGGAVVALAHRGLARSARNGPRSRSVSAPSSVTKTSPCCNGLIVPGSTLMYGSILSSVTLKPARLQQRAERRRRQPLAERGNHAAGDENEFGLAAFHRTFLPGLYLCYAATLRRRARARSSAVSISSDGATEATTRMR